MPRSATVIVLVAVLSAPAPHASADDPEDPHRPRLLLPIGLSVAVGGGVATFAAEDVRGYAGTAGSWDARLTVGTRLPIAVEIAYLGSVQTIDAIGLADDAVLLSNGAEVALRLNLADREWQPYLLAGAAWRRYAVTDVAGNTSDVADQDDVVELPIGLGVAFRYEGILVDGRATYRSAFDDDLMRGNDRRGGDLHTVGGSMTVGVEF